MNGPEPSANDPSEPTLPGDRPAWFLAAGCLLVLGVALAAGLAGWLLLEGSVPGESDHAVRVVASVAPIGWLVEQIGGEDVLVEVLIPPGQDPHSYAPTPREALALGRARVIVCTGLPLERQLLSRLSGEQLSAVIVDLTQASAPAQASQPESHADPGDDHDHAHGTDHDHLDPHVWLSPPLLREHARQIALALARVDPARAETYERRQRELDARLEAVDQRIAAQLKPHRGKTFYVFHPAFGRFGEAYGLRQQAIQWPGWAPSTRHLHDVIAQAHAHGARIILIQPQYDPRPAKRVADAVGASLVVADPLAPDMLANLEKLAGQIASGLEQPGAGVPEATAEPSQPAGPPGASGEPSQPAGPPEAPATDDPAGAPREQGKAHEP